MLVFDACALIAYLRREPGSDVVKQLLADADPPCLVHAVNLCEVYYDFVRFAGEAVAQSALRDLQLTGLTVRDDMTPDFWQEAGRLKAHGRLSLADCFAIALARRTGAEVVTSDHREFDPVAAAGICTVRFFR